MNHYLDFTWSELVDRGMDEAAMELGFTEQTWDNDEWPASFQKNWSDLTENEQWAAVRFCYWQDNW